MTKMTLCCFLLFALLASACQPTRTLQEGSYLYTGKALEFEGAEPEISNAKLENAISQRPNQRFLGMPVRLGIYNAFARKDSRFNRWVRNNIGEPPVIFDYRKAQTSQLRLEKQLIDAGYLQATARMDTLQAGQTVTAHYHLNAGERYELSEVSWPPDTSSIGRFIRAHQANSELLPDQPYQTQLLADERARLAEIGNEQGFYGLNPGHIYYFLDTTGNDHQARAYLRLADDPAGQPYQKHYIGQTTVYPVHYLEEPEWSYQDTLWNSGYRYIKTRDFVKPSVISRAILQQPGALYSRSLQQKSTNRLMALGAYKFVNLKFDVRSSGDSLYLDRSFYLTPNLTQDFSAELEVSTLSTASSSLNGGVNLNYSHRNLFGGAERLDLEGSANVATQIGQEVDFINSINLGLEASLRLPGMVSPFNLMGEEQSWQSSTQFQLRADFQRRTNFFSLFSASGSYGFNWKPSRLHRYEWKPVQLTRVNLINSTDAFDQRLADNPRLQQGFRDNLIFSTVFEYHYSEQQPGKQQNYLEMFAAVEPAGNFSYGIASLINPNQEKPYQFLGLPFAQFFRVEGGLQYHWYKPAAEWVARLNTGVAQPYGNAQSIPYIRQFFVGGSNSIRAWQIRALGPGAVPVEDLDAETFQDQTGDIKLEANVEYRFPIISYLKGALFADAGNIWLVERGAQDSRSDKGIFYWDEFYRQIAVGTGLGLRLDISYFVLRLDVAFPIRKPYNSSGNRWVFDEIALGDAGWRAENLVYNLALGYPF